ncbi:MAG: endonuclease III [Anaerolineae bacterium]|nr:endonuclease III [Anaerolineae bacterium]
MINVDDELRRRIAEIGRRLAAAYGEPEQSHRLDPVSQLVGTILSQNTNDRNRDLAFDRLRARLPSWAQVRDADPGLVVDAIRPAGLANQKGPHIQEALRAITRERGELSLDFLADWPVEKAKAWLCSIKGVGPKTAAIVLLFGLDMPAFPVDTHVHRVAKRLGLIGPVSREKAHVELEKLVPPESYYAFHLNLIRHGRQVCASRRPNCQACALHDLCRYYQEEKWANG